MKKLLTVGAIVVAVLLVAGLALPFLINANNFRPQIESYLTAALGRPVSIGSFSLSFFSGSVGAHQFSIADDPKFSHTPFVNAKALHVGVEMMPLIFRKQLNVTRIVIDQPSITLLRDRDGVWNFSSLGTASAQSKKAPANSSSAPANLNIAKLEISNGTLTLGSTTGQRSPIVYDKVNLIVRNFSFKGTFPFVADATLPGGGSLKLDGNAGPINSSDSALTPLQAAIKIRKLDLAQSAFVDPALGLGGLADFDGTLKSDGRTADGAGKLKATSLKLARAGTPATLPAEFTFSVQHDLQKETGKIAQADIFFGKALVKLTGTYDMHGPVTSVSTNLSGQSLPVDDLVALLPALAISLPSASKLQGGTLTLESATAGPLDKLISAGSLRLSNVAISGLDIGSGFSSIAGLVGKRTGNSTQIQYLFCNFRHAPDGTRLDNINITIPDLATITGAGTVSPSNALNFKVTANLSGAGADLTNLPGIGTSAIPIIVGGTTSNPSFTPDLQGMMQSRIKNLTGGKNSPLSGLSGLFGKKKP